MNAKYNRIAYHQEHPNFSCSADVISVATTAITFEDITSLHTKVIRINKSNQMGQHTKFVTGRCGRELDVGEGKMCPFFYLPA